MWWWRPIVQQTGPMILCDRFHRRVYACSIEYEGRERGRTETGRRVDNGRNPGIFRYGHMLEPTAITKIVRNFSDPTVGCVSSVDRFIDTDGTVSGEGAYVRYEMFLRNLETRVNTLVGLSGSFFAARRSVCRGWAPDLQSDFNTLLNSVRSSLRGVADPECVGFYKNLSDQKKEYDRKVRTIVRGISVFMRSLSLLNPFRYHLFAWQLFSHKLCRWLVPFAMIAALAANAVLASSSLFFQGTLAGKGYFMQWPWRISPHSGCRASGCCAFRHFSSW